jgi:cytochrome d ubiquinol oxidase subunit I
VFNPSFPYRLAHKLLASTLTAAFLIAGLSAWQLLRRTANAGTHRALHTAVVAAAVAIPLQILAGDMHGLNTLQHQPAKIAAIEGIWHTEKGAPLTLFGWPNEKEGRTDYAIQVPKLASLMLAHDIDAEIKGLNEFPGAHPPVAPVFWSFRIMVGMGLLMLAVSWWGAWTLWRHRKGSATAGLVFSAWQLRLLAGMTFSGWVATLAGWYVTEIGRQPFLVYGVLRTADLVAPHSGGMVLATLVAYLAVYAFLLVSYVLVLMYMAAIPPCPRPKHPKAPRPPRPLAVRPERRRTRMSWNDILPLIFMAVMGLALLAYVVLDGYDLGVGILLPRHRRGKGHHGLQHRPLLGRQRNLAGAGRRRAAGRLPQGAWPGAAGAVPAGGGDADRPDVARRGV